MASIAEIQLLIKTADSATKISDIRSSLKNLKSELLNVTEGSQEFDNLAQAAGRLTDRVGDVSARIKFLADDTKNLKGLVEIGKGVGASFGLAASATALLGTENKNLEKTLVRLQSIQLFLNSLQEIGNFLNKESTALLFLENSYNTIKNTLLGIQTGELTLATIATNAFNAATKALMGPVGLLIVGLTAIVGLFSLYTPKVDDAKIAQDEYNKKLEETNKIIALGEDRYKKIVESIKLRYDTEIVAAKGNQEKIAKIENEKAKELKLYTDGSNEYRLKALNKLIAEETVTNKKYSEKSRFEFERTEKIKSNGRLDALRASLVELEALTQEKTNKTNNDLAAAEKKIADEKLAINRKIRENEIALLEDGKTKELALLKENYDAQVIAAEGNSKLITSIENRRAKEIKDINEKFEKERIARIKTYQNNIDNVNETIRTNTFNRIEDDYTKQQALLIDSLANKQRELLDKNDLLFIELAKAEKNKDNKLQAIIISNIKKNQEYNTSLNKNYETDKEKLRRDTDKKILNEVNEFNIKQFELIKNQNIKEIDNLINNNDLTIDEINDLNAKKINLEINYIKEKAKLEGNEEIDSANKIKGLRKYLLTIEKDFNDEKIKLLEEGNFFQLSNESKAYKIAKDGAEKELKLEINKNNNLKLNLEGYYNDIINLKETQNTKLLELERQSNQTSTDLVYQNFTSSIDLLKTYIQNSNDEALKLIDNRKNATITAIDEEEQALKNLSSTKTNLQIQEEIIANEFATRRKEAEEKANEEKRAQTEKTFNYEKGLSISKTLIDGAITVQKTMSQFGYPLGLIPSALAVVQTGIQVATINAQEPPQYAQGGLIQGPGNGTSDSILARVSNGETIINAKSSRQFGPLLSEINAFQGNGKRFSTGGSVVTNSSSTINNNFDLAELKALLLEMNNRPIKTYVVSSEISASQLKDKNIINKSKI